jgi:hypothetical protein
MELRLAILVDRTGRIAQTSVLADDPADRAEGHRLLQLIDPELSDFAAQVQARLERARAIH